MDLKNTDVEITLEDGSVIVADSLEEAAAHWAASRFGKRWPLLSELRQSIEIGAAMTELRAAYERSL